MTQIKSFAALWFALYVSLNHPLEVAEVGRSFLPVGPAVTLAVLVALGVTSDLKDLLKSDPNFHAGLLAFTGIIALVLLKIGLGASVSEQLRYVIPVLAPTAGMTIIASYHGNLFCPPSRLVRSSMYLPCIYVIIYWSFLNGKSFPLSAFDGRHLEFAHSVPIVALALPLLFRNERATTFDVRAVVSIAALALAASRTFAALILTYSIFRVIGSLNEMRKDKDARRRTARLTFAVTLVVLVTAPIYGRLGASSVLVAARASAELVSSKLLTWDPNVPDSELVNTTVPDSDLLETTDPDTDLVDGLAYTDTLTDRLLWWSGGFAEWRSGALTIFLGVNNHDELTGNFKDNRGRASFLVHNDFLQVLYGLGLFGLALTFLTWVSFFRFFIEYFPGKRDRNIFTIFIGIHLLSSMTLPINFFIYSSTAVLALFLLVLSSQSTDMDRSWPRKAIQNNDRRQGPEKI